MKIDITSMFFNSKIEGKTSTAAWGTSISKQTPPCLVYDDEETTNIISGLLFCSNTDKEHWDVKGISGNREIILFSVFDKIYVNGKKVDNASFILLLVKEHSESHEGRLILSYPMYAKYYRADGSIVSNEETKDKMAEMLGCKNGCWFVSEISVVNQDTLLFNAHIVNAEAPAIYKGTSKQRSAAWKSIVEDSGNIPNKKIAESLTKDNPRPILLQQIYYGAPGTGKSNEIKILTQKKFSKDFTFRTTFHPDTDYSSFVGAYKPVWDEGKDKITYVFRAQTFLRAYISAWRHPQSNVALVIEEINRGNCAQIFGDIFQLLDREDDGLSKYPIEADIDMRKFIENEFSKDTSDVDGISLDDYDKDIKNRINEYYNSHYEDAFEKIKNGEIITLPINLSILATMNTSDQSLFPMDSAFKRRWDWIYQPIVEGTDDTGRVLDWKIKIDNEHKVDWWIFLKSINREIADLTTSEDKQLGYFFCMPDEKVSPDDDKQTIISAKRFVGKVIFYLWNDVFKAYGYDRNCCKDEESQVVYYEQFYDKEYTGKTSDEKVVNLDVLTHFFETLNGEDGKPIIEKSSQTENTSQEAENSPHSDNI